MSIVRLGDILTVQNGFAFKSELFCDKGAGVPIVRIRDLRANDTEANYNGPFRDEFIVRKGDMLIGMDGDFECRVWQGGDALLNQRVCRLGKFAQGVVPQYVFYAIHRELKAIHATTAFVTVKHLSSKQIADIQLALPPLTDQQRIVDILDRASGIQRLRNAADDKMRDLVPALFVDLFGDPASNPKRWETKSLKEVSNIGSGITKGRKLDPSRTVSVPYLRVANVQDGKLDLSEIKNIDIDADEREKYALRAGDIVMTEGGDIDKLGRGYVWQGELPYCAHQNHVFRVRVDENVLHPFFLSALIGTSHGKSYFLRVAKRTTGIASINKTQLGELPVWLPPISLQRSFVNKLETLHSMQQMADRAVATIEATAAALSRQLLG